MSELILGTAGHIDHGKTALVRALTGIDTDRLEEEKQRGISIDIGFAHLDLGGHRLGIVDVPGHERFIRNMMAGASGVDVALLVVAADDSVMPQTREHLAILELLQVRQGVIALTKCDLADASWLELVADDVRELVRGTFLEPAPIVRTSAQAGTGLDDLRAALTEVCGRVRARETADLFCLHVDRAFALPGRGTVVSGTVWSGRAAAGDELDWLPPGRRVRVRSVQSHGRDADDVHQGQRAAFNLTGVKHHEIERGHVLSAPGYLAASRHLTVRLRVLAESPWPLRHRGRVRVHVGTREAMAELRLLAGNALGPGEWGYAQLRLAEPVVASGRQPFVIRTESPLRTIGGGIVLEPSARPISRRAAAGGVIELLAALDEGDERARAAAALELRGAASLEPVDLCRQINVSRERAAAICGRFEDEGVVRRLAVSPRRTLALHREVLADLRRRLLGAMEKLHAAAPLEALVPRQRLVQRLGWLEEDLVVALVNELLAEGGLAGDEQAVALPGFEPTLTEAQRRLRAQVIEAYESAGFSPPEPEELARSGGVSDQELRPIIQLCVSQNHLCHVEGGLYLHRRWEGELRRRLRESLGARPGLTVSEIRDLLETSRKYAVPFCEYLDRVGVTRRENDVRVLRE